jgi:hypothetical protein
MSVYENKKHYTLSVALLLFMIWVIFSPGLHSMLVIMLLVFRCFKSYLP